MPGRMIECFLIDLLLLIDRIEGIRLRLPLNIIFKELAIQQVIMFRLMNIVVVAHQASP